jgi:hypothetical protein
MDPSMAIAGVRTESQGTTAPAVAEPSRRPSTPTLSDAVLRMQRTAGNAAVARAVARPAERALQRCGAGCGCASCSSGHAHDDELLEDEKLGAGLLRSAVARRSA